MNRFKDKVAVITGSGQGIGQGVALAFASEGALVAIVDMDEGRAKDSVKKIKAQGGQALPVKLDVTNSGEVGSAFQKITNDYGKIDILVNNVGFGRMKLFVDTPEDVWDTIITTNLKSTLICCRTVLDQMIKRKYGKIVNISSTAAIRGAPAQAVYAAAKGGIISFTRALAREVAQYHISVNCIAPGATETPQLALTRVDRPEEAEAIRKSIPWGRVGEPKDIAAAILFLTSDEAEFMVGQTLCVSGGLVMI